MSRFLRACGLLSLLSASSLFAALNESALLDAIAMVETGNRPDVIGRARERGAWQLTPAVRARVGGYDRAAAQKWLNIVMADMRAYGIYINPTNTALCWNAGVHGVRKGRAPMSSYLYSQRVDNLYHSLVSEYALTGRGKRH